MMKWEYKTIRFRADSERKMKGFDPAELDEQLNAIGADGWELSASFDTNAVFGGTRTIVVIFKRPAEKS